MIEKDDFLQTHIFHLDIPAQAVKILNSRNIKTVKDLLGLTEFNLIIMDGLGSTSLKKIKKELKQRNLYLSKVYSNRMVYDGYAANLISQLEDLLLEKDDLVAKYRKERPGEDDDRYICEVIAAKFVHDKFREVSDE